MSVLERKEAISERLNEVLLKEIRAIVVDALTEAAEDIAMMHHHGAPERERALIELCERTVLAHAGKIPARPRSKACGCCLNWDSRGMCLANEPVRRLPWECCDDWEGAT